MCARLGLVSGMGLSAAIRSRYSTPVLWFSCLLLVSANVVNIGADFAGMGECLEVLTGLPRFLWVLVMAFGILGALVFWNYKRLAMVFKWLTAVLAAYVFAAFLAHPNWPAVFKATLVPSLRLDSGYLMAFLGILGTTISPYLFFWQAAEEVEEEREKGRRTLRERRGATPQELGRATKDVVTGMFWSNMAMFFIMLTTASTIHGKAGLQIETAKQAAEALRPIAGESAFLLFTLGIVGTGVLAIPVLAGSAAYAVSEAMHWRGSLSDKPKQGRKFYVVLGVAILLGLGLELLHVNAVKALFYAAVFNGVLAPPLVFIVTMLTSDKRVMGDKVNPWPLRALGYFTAALMAAAALGLLWTTLR